MNEKTIGGYARLIDVEDLVLIRIDVAGKNYGFKIDKQELETLTTTEGDVTHVSVITTKD